MAVRNGVTVRGTSNTNDRGSAKSRRERKVWLLATFDPDLGPDLARCAFEDCEAIVDFDTITVDRYPVPGCRGGRYVRGNIRPVCGPCNSRHGGALRSGQAEADVEGVA